MPSACRIWNPASPGRPGRRGADVRPLFEKAAMGTSWSKSARAIRNIPLAGPLHAMAHTRTDVSVIVVSATLVGLLLTYLAFGMTF